MMVFIFFNSTRKCPDRSGEALSSYVPPPASPEASTVMDIVIYCKSFQCIPNAFLGSPAVTNLDLHENTSLNLSYQWRQYDSVQF